jgi:hypothetical protein
MPCRTAAQYLKLIMNCIKCNREFLNEELVASISGSIMGDEYTDSYFLCPVCLVYTVASWRDNFTGEETVNMSGPISEKEGIERIALIRKCPEPWDKKCRCKAHRAYFNDSLD